MSKKIAYFINTVNKQALIESKFRKRASLPNLGDTLILIQLSKGKAAIDIRKARGISMSCMGSALRRLHNEGYILITQSESDARRTTASLTRRGLRMLERCTDFLERQLGL